MSADGDSEPGRRELGLLSVVVPLLDAEHTVRVMHERVSAALQGVPFELVAVDDGSADGTGEILRELAEVDPRVRVVHLSRSFGREPALTAGLDHAHGDAVVTLEGDLRDPPEVIPALLERWRAGSDVVYAVGQHGEGEGPRAPTARRWLGRLFERLAGLPAGPEVGELRLLDRGAVDALLAMPERGRSLRGMSVWVGFTQTAVGYQGGGGGAERPGWRSGARRALDAASSFSRTPLRIATLLGLAFALLALLAIPVAVGVAVARGSDAGRTLTILAILLLGGVQLVTVGVVGEYVGRIYDEVKRRPLYVVRARRNL